MIDERPSVVNLRNRIGDWEVDTIVSRKHRDVLVTLVERYSRFTLIGKSTSRHSTQVAKVIRDMFRFHKSKVLTITSDNGTEFAQHKRISNWLDAGFYFCHPYSSWERGLNENTNGLIRQYAPKGSSFSHFTNNHLKQLMGNLNNRPRKCLDYKTPREVYYSS
jgi:transposase, IS30 family